MKTDIYTLQITVNWLLLSSVSDYQPTSFDNRNVSHPSIKAAFYHEKKKPHLLFMDNGISSSSSSSFP